MKDTNNYAWIQRGQVTKQKGKGFQTGLSLFRGCAVAPVVGQAVERFFLNQIPCRGHNRKSCYRSRLESICRLEMPEKQRHRQKTRYPLHLQQVQREATWVR